MENWPEKLMDSSIRAIVKKYAFKLQAFMSRDDIAQEARMECIKAWSEYRIGKGMTPQSFISRRIESRLISIIRSKLSSRCDDSILARSEQIYTPPEDSDNEFEALAAFREACERVPRPQSPLRKLSIGVCVALEWYRRQHRLTIRQLYESLKVSYTLRQAAAIRFLPTLRAFYSSMNNVDHYLPEPEEEEYAA